MPRALVLFSGTDSTGRYLRENGWQTVTLDWDPKMRPDICEDIHAWDHTVYPPGHFDFVQASPDCTEWSPAMTCRPRDIDKATRLVLRTFDVIEYFRAPFWMENPGGAALLHTQPFMAIWEFCRTEVTYCNFGMPYRKLTSCWVARPVPCGCWEKVEFELRGKCPHKSTKKRRSTMSERRRIARRSSSPYPEI